MERDAEKLLTEAVRMCAEAGCTTGWAEHSRYAAEFARAVAGLAGMDGTRAYCATLLHDCGRFDPRGNGRGAPLFWHEVLGFRFLMSRGRPEWARYCITHGYLDQGDLSTVSEPDAPAEVRELVSGFLASIEYDDYDRLVQLADGIALKECYVTLEQRAIDSMFRYGRLEAGLDRFKMFMSLKTYFDAKCGWSVYEVVPGFMDMAARFRYDYL
ncbi:MAG: HD domain-containing protein [Rickettsiales bacterium]|jgi:hypothetical protein|nr:HD domain-containing protein [Rickettsiales bacterium]